MSREKSKEKLEELNKKEKFFDKININPKREVDETREAYKARMVVNKKLIKGYLKGKTVWSPSQPFKLPQTKDGKIVYDENGEMLYTEQLVVLGPYVKSQHGPLK